ncbi:PASTA domain-containing protein [Gemmiger formicilis]|uniref:protein kinase domain-containing protein n=1 Tax=Gemmiger formicilis TaxID=745368 RepID=UPI00210D8F22|nr:PASTA domain-containing protein [Gemmiger formicilis]MCQ5079338.1 PASTA domain-containing protein [Gemmiger formicilis]MCQ5115334.1 PASTA domain-containing protein [Gemmiger formicilis]
MPKLLCPHCLQPLEDGYHGECPHCGRSLENRNPEGALPFGTQLGDKYTVGAYLSADGDGLAYRGVLNAEKRFVLIKEYFPVTLCNGRSASGALMPKEDKEVLFKTSRMDFKDLYDDLHSLTPATGLSTILDVIEENNTVYAVEESEKGMTLSHYLHLRSRTLTPAEARTLLQPIMEGVALLHKSGLIHRGICPDNILLPIDGTARLTGYGTLALRTGGSELKSQLYPGYAAPEQYSAAEFSGRYTDVYALAAVCYRMVTGQTPVAAPQRKVRDSMESAHSLEAGVPTWFSQVLACALRLDPAKRMQTVPELMSALTDPNVANAMFERGDNQISTRKIMGVSLVVIFVLVVLLLWSLLGGSKSDAQPAATPQPTPAEQSTQGETVPNLVGLRYATDIKGNTAYDGYRIVMTEQNSDTVEQGIVISQDPSAGSEKLMEDQILQIVVSSGPNLVEMPDIVTGNPIWSQAKKQLDALGIVYSQPLIEDNDGTVAEGCVVKTSVVAGTKIQKGTAVTVWIAGPRDDTLVAQTGNAGESTPEPTPQPEA